MNSRVVVCFTAILLVTCLAASERPSVSFVIHGRAPLEPQVAVGAAGSYIETATFVGEPVVLTVAVRNLSPADAANLPRLLKWDVRANDGEPLALVPVALGPGVAPAGRRLRTSYYDFQLTNVTPGQYTINVNIAPTSGEPTPAEPRRLIVYRGDESPAVRREWLRRRAESALASDTEDGYRAARALLLDAARDSTDPSLYDRLADISAPWAQPEETAEYYKRSTDLARRNLEAKFGDQKNWPARGAELYETRTRKERAFREIVPFYRMNFADVRVVVLTEGKSARFVVQRRKDGKHIRTVELK